MKILISGGCRKTMGQKTIGHILTAHYPPKSGKIGQSRDAQANAVRPYMVASAKPKQPLARPTQQKLF